MKGLTISIAIIMVLVPMATVAMEENPDAAPPTFGTNTVELDSLSAAIEQARLAEDAGLVMALEAQRPERALEGEQLAGPVLLHQTKSYSGGDDPGGLPEIFSGDIKIAPVFSGDVERSPVMASDSNGNLWAAWEDNVTANPSINYIPVYKSTDGGASWSFFGSITNVSSSLDSPSIAVGEGSQGNTLLVAYVVDDGVSDRYLEVATAPLSGGSFTIHSVTAYTDWDYYNPVIWTDSHEYSFWYGYLVAEAIFAGTSTNRNVQFTRNTDGGTTWTDTQVPWGNTDALTWKDPDGTRGGAVQPPPSFIVCFNDSDDTIYMRRSDDTGATWDPQTAISTSSAATSSSVDPEIEAAHGVDSLFLLATWRFSDSTTDDMAYWFTSDFGVSWDGPYSNMRHSSTSQWGPTLKANEGGGSFHMAYTETGQVFLSTRPSDLSFFSTLNLEISSSAAVPSMSYPKKGVASNWDNDYPGVVWTDFRVGLPEYEVYFNTTTVIFDDGFETGNATAWSSTVP